MLRRREPSAAGADEKAATLSRQQKKLVAKLDEKKAKRAPAVVEEPVAPEVKRKRMMKIGGAIISFILIAYVLEVRRLNRLDYVEPLDVRPGSEFYRSVKEYAKRAEENMKPIREAEAKIFAEDGLGFQLRWMGLPEEVRLQSTIAAMNEFTSAPFIANLLLEGADPRFPRPGPVAQDLLPELFAFDARTIALTDHMLRLFQSLVLGFENGIPAEKAKEMEEAARNATEARLANMTDAERAELAAAEKEAEEKAAAEAAALAAEEAADPAKAEEAAKRKEVLEAHKAAVEAAEKAKAERMANMTKADIETAELLIESRRALRSFYLSDFLRLVMKHAPLEKVQRAPPEVEKEFYDKEEAKAKAAEAAAALGEGAPAAAEAEAAAAAGDAAAAA